MNDRFVLPFALRQDIINIIGNAVHNKYTFADINIIIKNISELQKIEVVEDDVQKLD